jgi:hypothetical protein
LTEDDCDAEPARAKSLYLPRYAKRVLPIQKAICRPTEF